MNRDIQEMQKAFAEILLLNEGQRVAKFTNNTIYVDGQLVVLDGEIIQ